MKLIPKIKISDEATWIDEPTIAIDLLNLNRYKPVLHDPFFAGKEIIVLPIIPDDLYVDLEGCLAELTKEYNRESFLFVSHDCACYNDLPHDCEEELVGLEILNESLFENFKIDIGLLKGFDITTYRETQLSLTGFVDFYMIYLTGEIRSNPRWFKVNEWLSDTFTLGLEKPVYLHGCPLKQISGLDTLGWEIEGVITAGHIADAIYRGPRNYKRKTRIKTAWQKWKAVIE